MSAFVTALRWDIVVQARNGFYWATAFVVLVVRGLGRLPSCSRTHSTLGSDAPPVRSPLPSLRACSNDNSCAARSTPILI